MTQTTTTIPVVVDEANQLFEALAGDLNVKLDLPDLTLPTDFQLPSEANNPAYKALDPISVEQLTTKVVGGTGVFDALMASINVHMAGQYEKGRITGGDYAKAYQGAILGAMQFGVQFLLGKDQAYLSNLLTQAQVQLAQAQKVKAAAEIQIARAQVQQMAFTSIEMRFKAYSSRNEYANTKMALVTNYNNVLTSEAQALLTSEQVDSQRAQTKDTLADGTVVAGVIGVEKSIKEAEKETALEQTDSARAQTKDTLRDGKPIGGIAAVDKAFKLAQQDQMENQGKLTLEQVETQRAQTKDTLTTGGAIGGLMGVEKQTKVVALNLVTEQVETQRAQTWDTHSNGSAISGILAVEKSMKTNQALLVKEQYETQRGQTRATLSTGETVVGVIGAQTKLYNQQVISYQRDAESKYAKLMLDTWTARKTIDEGVAVPANIDSPAINTMMQTYRSNLSL